MFLRCVTIALLLHHIRLLTIAAPLPPSSTDRAMSASTQKDIVPEIQTCKAVTSSLFSDYADRKISFVQLGSDLMTRGMGALKLRVGFSQESDNEDIEEPDRDGDVRNENETRVIGTSQNESCVRYSYGVTSSIISSPDGGQHLAENEKLSLDLFLQREQLEYLEVDEKQDGQEEFSDGEARSRRKRDSGKVDRAVNRNDANLADGHIEAYRGEE